MTTACSRSSNTVTLSETFISLTNIVSFIDLMTEISTVKLCGKSCGNASTSTKSLISWIFPSPSFSTEDSPIITIGTSVLTFSSCLTAKKSMWIRLSVTGSTWISWINTIWSMSFPFKMIGVEYPASLYLLRKSFLIQLTLIGALRCFP